MVKKESIISEISRTAAFNTPNPAREATEKNCAIFKINSANL